MLAFTPACSAFASVLTRTVQRPAQSIRCNEQEVVVPQWVFAQLDYDQEYVPWDTGTVQPPVRDAARDGAFLVRVHHCTSARLRLWRRRQCELARRPWA